MIPAAVVTVSDRSAAGVRTDTAGPVAVAALRAAGFACEDAVVVPDGADHVESALRMLLADGMRLIITSGGTGVAPRDRTPEGTAPVLERTIPGIAEELRRAGAAASPRALLTRGLSGIAGSTLIINLPGSPKAVDEGMPLVLALAPHILAQLDGEDHS